MDFKDAYKREMGAVEPSPGSLERLRRASAAQQAEPTDAPAEQRPAPAPAPARPSRRWKRWGQATLGIAASAVIVLLAVTAVQRGVEMVEDSATDALSSAPMSSESAPAGSKNAQASPQELQTERSYDTVYQRVFSLKIRDFLASIDPLSLHSRNIKGEMETDAFLATDAAGYSSASQEAPSSPVFSDTNVQVQGVQEGDIIKTDGRYLYVGIMSDTKVTILRANQGNPEIVATIDLGAGLARPQENANEEPADVFDYGADPTEPSPRLSQIYLTAERLVVIGEDSLSDTTVSVALIYDIRDPERPSLVRRLEQSGSLNDTRMVGDSLYLITDYEDIDLARTRKDHPRTYVPCTRVLDPSDTHAPAATPMRAQDIVACPAPLDWIEYTVVSGIDTSSGAFVSTKSYLGPTDIVYASQSSIYLASAIYADDWERPTREGSANSADSGTQLVRIGCDDGRLTFKARNVVPGDIINQFALDEKDGVLRIVTTSTPRAYGASKRTSALYTLDGNLERLGKTENVAPDEDVYSVRFIGDMAYFVTFRQVDPLFSVDVSDPSHPQLVGALKIPGFSEYLHPYADGLLFGLGNDADEETGARGELKLTMFDNSDPANVTEKHTLVIADAHYSPASSDHKAILVDARTRLIAFPVEDAYLIYTYDPATGFEKRFELPFDEGYAREYGGDLDARGLFIDDAFYVFEFDYSDSSVRLSTYDLGTFARRETTRF